MSVAWVTSNVARFVASRGSRHSTEGRSATTISAFVAWIVAADRAVETSESAIVIPCSSTTGAAWLAPDPSERREKIESGYKDGISAESGTWSLPSSVPFSSTSCRVTRNVGLAVGKPNGAAAATSASPLGTPAPSRIRRNDCSVAAALAESKIASWKSLGSSTWPGSCFAPAGAITSATWKIGRSASSVRPSVTATPSTRAPASGIARAPFSCSSPRPIAR